MSDPSDRSGFVLPGMPWFSEIEAESRFIAREWQAGRQTAQIKQPKTNSSHTNDFAVTAGVRRPLGSEPVSVI